MLASIYFNNYFSIEADKVHYETFERNLSSKFETDKAPVS